MDDLRVARLDLHRLDPAILVELHFRELIDPPVGTVRVHREVVRRRHLQIRLADEPVGVGRERQRRRHVGGIALRRAGLDPPRDRRDLVVSERSIVLVVTDPDGLVEMPRRHVAVDDALLDRARPRPNFVVRRQRHRDRRAGMVARLTRLLKDRRDVFAERWRSRGRHRARRRFTLDRDLHLRVGPAAVIPELSRRFARSVIDDGLQDVLARFGERRRRRCLAVHQLRLRRAERDVAGTAVLRPEHGHARGLSAADRKSVIGCRHRQRGRAARRGHRCRRRLQLDGRRRVRVDAFAVAAARRADPIDLPHGVERAGDAQRLPVRRQRPDKLAVLRKIVRHRHLEDVLVAARYEVRRLPAIAARFEGVRRAGWNVDRLFLVAVHVAEPHVVGAVGVDIEALVHGRDALSVPVAHLHHLRDAGGLREQRGARDCDEEPDESNSLHIQPLLLMRPSPEKFSRL